MIQIVIGTEPAQYVTQQVLIYSINKFASEDVDIRLPEQAHDRVGGTNFGFVRFYTPTVFDFKGTAIYMDADQVVFHDVKDLAQQLEPGYAVACVQEPVGNFGKKVVQRGNQTSVMVMDCAQLTYWDPATMFKNVVGNRDPLGPGQIHYRDFMMLGAWNDIKIQALDPRWNHFNIKQDDTKLTHFSHVRSQPWKNPEHDLTDFWGGWMTETIEAGYLTKDRVVEEIQSGHVDPYFEKFL